jgi:hypothetical protein
VLQQLGRLLVLSTHMHHLHARMQKQIKKCIQISRAKCGSLERSSAVRTHPPRNTHAPMQ